MLNLKGIMMKFLKKLEPIKYCFSYLIGAYVVINVFSYFASLFTNAVNIQIIFGCGGIFFWTIICIMDHLKKKMKNKNKDTINEQIEDPISTR